MIRVQEMNLRPDGTGTKLIGNIQFIASYQKKQALVKPTSGSVAKPAPAPAPASKPATNAPVPAANAKPATVKTNAVKTVSTNTVRATAK